MRLSEIKTRDQFNEMADVQYQRTVKLAGAMNDAGKPPMYRTRAGLLWLKSMKRIQKLISMYAKMNTPKSPNNFKSGGFSNPRIAEDVVM
jgi:hypothetical protein